MNPYLDLNGFKLRTLMPSSDVDIVEQVQPGFTVQRLASWSSRINAAARKRYGNNPNLGNHLPFGQIAPALVANGTTPPVVLLTGRPVLGCLRIWIQMLTGGALGTATYAWSADGGTTWAPNTPAALLAGAGSGIVTSSKATLGSTGLVVNFPSGADYASDNVYRSDTPVPEAVLSWLVTVVTVDLYIKRGTNPQDPGIAMLVDEKAAALKDLEEAANGKDGLLDLPISEDLDSAVTTGGPQGYSEASPYVGFDIEANMGVQQDAMGRGSF